MKEYIIVKPTRGGLFTFSIYYLKIHFHNLNVPLKRELIIAAGPREQNVSFLGQCFPFLLGHVSPS